VTRCLAVRCRMLRSPLHRAPPLVPRVSVNSVGDVARCGDQPK
jgi:hypothetical protein